MKRYWEIKKGDFKDSKLKGFLTLKDIQRILKSKYLDPTEVDVYGNGVYEPSKVINQIEKLTLDEIYDIVENQKVLESIKHDATCLIREYDAILETYVRDYTVKGYIKNNIFYYTNPEGIGQRRNMNPQKTYKGIKLLELNGEIIE